MTITLTIGPMGTGKTRSCLINYKDGDIILIPSIFGWNRDLLDGLLKSRDPSIKGRPFLFFKCDEDDEYLEKWQSPTDMKLTADIFSNITGSIHVDEANYLTVDEANNIINISIKLGKDLYLYGYEFDYFRSVFPGIKVFLDKSDHVVRLVIKDGECYTTGCQNVPKYDFLERSELGFTNWPMSYSEQSHSMCEECHKISLLHGLSKC